MKATCLTSAIAGVLYGIVVAILGPAKSNFPLFVLILSFIVSSIVGVIGISQLLEMLAERQRRGLGWFGVMAENHDFQHFYIPAWVRMIVWLFTAAITTLVVKGIIS